MARKRTSRTAASAKVRQRRATDPHRGDLRTASHADAITSLPADIRRRINTALAERPQGLESVRKIFDHFKLRERRIPYRAFADYVRRQDWRVRLGAAARVAGAMLGSPEQGEPERVCNSALLHLMSVVVRTLEENDADFSTADLGRLSKIIAEQRTATTKERGVEMKTKVERTKTSDRDGQARPMHTGLPDNFDDIVRRIYGVELKDEGRREKYELRMTNHADKNKAHESSQESPITAGE